MAKRKRRSDYKTICMGNLYPPKLDIEPSLELQENNDALAKVAGKYNIRWDIKKRFTKNASR